MGSHKLEHTFPRLFALETRKRALVHERLTRHGEFSWQWRRAIRGGREEQELLSLSDMLKEVHLADGDDEWRWNLHPSGIFTVAELRNKTDFLYLPTQPPITSWNKLVPHKVNIMYWRLLRDRLPRSATWMTRALTCTLCYAHYVMRSQKMNVMFFVIADTLRTFG